MRKTIKNKILISLLAMSSVNLFTSAEVFAVDVTVDDNKVTSHGYEYIERNADFNGYKYTKDTKDNYNNNNITVSNSTLGNFYGILLQDQDFGGPHYSLTNNKIAINSSTINGNITGIKAGSFKLSATGLTLSLKDTTIYGNVVGADLKSSIGSPAPIHAGNIKIAIEGSSTITGDIILVARSINPDIGTCSMETRSKKRPCQYRNLP